MEPEDPKGEGQPDLEGILADVELAAGSEPEARPSDGNDAQTGSTAAKFDLSKEVEIPKLGRVKLQDLVSAYGRQKALQRTQQTYSKYTPVIKALETDPGLLNDLLDEIEERQNGKTSAPAPDEPEDEETLWEKNPAMYLRMQIERDREARAAERIDAEEDQLRQEFKLNEDQVRQVERVAMMYQRPNGDPIPLREAYGIWSQPQLLKRQQELTEQVNARASGIPSGARMSAELSRKPVEKMTDAELEQAMMHQYGEQERKRR